MGQLTTFDEPLRDPRGPTLSVALWAVVAATDLESKVQWSTFDQVPDLAFDHRRIVQAGRDLTTQKHNESDAAN